MVGCYISFSLSLLPSFFVVRVQVLTKELAMTLLAVGLAIVLCKGTTSKGIHAEGTNKVLRVPFLVQGIHNATGDGLAASCAQASGLLVVVHLAIRLPSMFVKCTPRKGLLAVLAHKVLRVPFLP